MKPINQYSLLLVALLAMAGSAVHASHWTSGMKDSKVELKSIGPITFGPEGILFIADTKAAAVYAIATDDSQSATSAKPIQVPGLNQKIASLLGTTSNDILIQDVAVNPAARTVYVAVLRGRGPDAKAALVRVDHNGQLQNVNLGAVKAAKAELPDAPVDGVVGEGNRQSNPRQESITDIAFLEDRVLIAGLSNEEFSSTLRAIPFPFKTVVNGTSVEIFHGAHGRFETRSPVRTFVPFNVGHEPHLLAAYTCTPLVQFPIKELKPGAKIKGKTIAELGNRNRPLDMIVYQKDGKDFLLLANNNRGIMKINAANIEGTQGILEPVKDGAKQGLAYETIDSWSGVEQLDRLDAQHAIVLRRAEGGAFNLETLALP